MGQCHDKFDLWFFCPTTPTNPLICGLKRAEKSPRYLLIHFTLTSHCRPHSCVEFRDVIDIDAADSKTPKPFWPCRVSLCVSDTRGFSLWHHGRCRVIVAGKPLLVSLLNPLNPYKIGPSGEPIKNGLLAIFQLRKDDGDVKSGRPPPPPPPGQVGYATVSCRFSAFSQLRIMLKSKQKY